MCLTAHWTWQKQEEMNMRLYQQKNSFLKKNEEYQEFLK